MIRRRKRIGKEQKYEVEKSLIADAFAFHDCRGGILYSTDSRDSEGKRHRKC